MYSHATPPRALDLSHRVLRLLIKLNVVMGLFILGLLVASVVATAPVLRALGGPRIADNPRIIPAMWTIMVIGIVAVPITHVVLARLLDIVDTVRAGDPFTVVNAARLRTIAWAILGLEVLHLVVGAVAAAASTEDSPLDLDWSFSVTRWLAVLLLFVLARVFEQGARMRQDLEGTV